MTRNLKQLFLHRPLFLINVCFLFIPIIYCLINSPHLHDIKNKTKVCVVGKVDFISKSKKSNVVILKNIRTLNLNTNKHSDIGTYVRTYIKDDIFNNYQILPTTIVKITGEFNPNKNARNDGGFDSLNYYYSKGETGSIFLSDIKILKQAKKFSLKKYAYYVRTHLLKIIEVLYNGKEEGIIKAVFLGERSFLDSGIKKLYRDNGLLHILAISGLHLSFIGMLIYKGLEKCKIHTYVSTFVMLGILFFYIIMCGQSPSMVRAYIMIFIRYMGRVLGRSSDFLTSLSIAWAIILIINPYKLYDQGFILSFLAIFLIGYFFPKIKGSDFIRTIYFQIGMMPVLISNYFVYPTYSIISNLLIVPLFGILLVLILFTVFLFDVNLNLAYFLSDFVKVIFEYYEKVCLIIRKFYMSFIYIGKQPLIFSVDIVLIFLGLVIFSVINKKELEDYETYKKEKNIVNISHIVRYFSCKIAACKRRR